MAPEPHAIKVSVSIVFVTLVASLLGSESDVCRLVRGGLWRYSAIRVLFCHFICSSILSGDVAWRDVAWRKYCRRAEDACAACARIQYLCYKKRNARATGVHKRFVLFLAPLVYSSCNMLCCLLPRRHVGVGGDHGPFQLVPPKTFCEECLAVHPSITNSCARDRMHGVSPPFLGQPNECAGCVRGRL